MAENNERQPPDSFVYQPLDPSKREIRLLYLDPISSSSGLISGAIVHVFTKFESCISEKTDSGTYWLRSQTPLKVELDYDALKSFSQYRGSGTWLCAMGFQTRSLISLA